MAPIAIVDTSTASEVDMLALQTVGLMSLGCAFIGMIYGELLLLHKCEGVGQMKVRLEYDLPEFDPAKHDPDKTFAFLTYRGVHYAKWVNLKPLGGKSWKIRF